MNKLTKLWAWAWVALVGLLFFLLVATAGMAFEHQEVLKQYDFSEYAVITSGMGCDSVEHTEVLAEWMVAKKDNPLLPIPFAPDCWFVRDVQVVIIEWKPVLRTGPPDHGVVVAAGTDFTGDVAYMFFLEETLPRHDTSL